MLDKNLENLCCEVNMRVEAFAPELHTSQNSDSNQANVSWNRDSNTCNMPLTETLWKWVDFPYEQKRLKASLRYTLSLLSLFFLLSFLCHRCHDVHWIICSPSSGSGANSCLRPEHFLIRPLSPHSCHLPFSHSEQLDFIQVAFCRLRLDKFK